MVSPINKPDDLCCTVLKINDISPIRRRESMSIRKIWAAFSCAVWISCFIGRHGLHLGNQKFPIVCLLLSDRLVLHHWLYCPVITVLPKVGRNAFHEPTRPQVIRIKTLFKARSVPGNRFFSNARCTFSACMPFQRMSRYSSSYRQGNIFRLFPRHPSSVHRTVADGYHETTFRYSSRKNSCSC